MSNHLEQFADRIAHRFGVDGHTVLNPDSSGTDDHRVGIWRPDESMTGADAEERLRSALDDILADRPALIVAASVATLGHEPLPTLRTRLATAGHDPDFVGFAPHPAEGTVVAVLRGSAFPDPAPAPAGFRVAAIMTAYNERDIIRPSIEHLIAQGIDVHLIDNWSQDDTVALVEDLVGHGLLAIERFPEGGRTGDYRWSQLLAHVTEVAATFDHDWIIHHDVDQRRESPWCGRSYKDALFTAETWGFNAVDHTLLEFRPVDNDFRDGTEVSDHHRYFEFVPSSATATHVQAWKNLDVPVDLADSGGHNAVFDGRRVFPYNFLLRHYPIRSQRHGELKVFRDRKPRYRSDEMNKGWHYHYARLRKGHQFLRSPDDLIEWDPSITPQTYMLPLLGQTGIQFADPKLKERLRSTAAAGLQRTGLGSTYVKARTRLLRRLG